MNEQGRFDEVVRITNKLFFGRWHKQKAEWFIKHAATWHLMAVVQTNNKKEIAVGLFFFKNFYPSVYETGSLGELLPVVEEVVKKQYYLFVKPFYWFLIAFSVLELFFDFFSIYATAVFLVLGCIEIFNRKNVLYNFSFIAFQGLLFVKSLYRWTYWTFSKPPIKIKYTEI